MTNREKYCETIIDVIINHNSTFGVHSTGKFPIECNSSNCSICDFYYDDGVSCDTHRKIWIKEIADCDGESDKSEQIVHPIRSYPIGEKTISISALKDAYIQTVNGFISAEDGPCDEKSRSDIIWGCWALYNKIMENEKAVNDNA